MDGMFLLIFLMLPLVLHVLVDKDLTNKQCRYPWNTKVYFISSPIFKPKDLGPIDFGNFIDLTAVDLTLIRSFFTEYLKNEMNSTIFISIYNWWFVECNIGYIEYSYVSFAYKSVIEQCIEIDISTLQQFLQQFLLLHFSSNAILSYIGGPNSSSFASVFAEIVRDPLV